MCQAAKMIKYKMHKYYFHESVIVYIIFDYENMITIINLQ